MGPWFIFWHYFTISFFGLYPFNIFWLNLIEISLFFLLTIVLTWCLALLKWLMIVREKKVQVSEKHSFKDWTNVNIQMNPEKVLLCIWNTSLNHPMKLQNIPQEMMVKRGSQNLLNPFLYSCRLILLFTKSLNKSFQDFI